MRYEVPCVPWIMVFVCCLEATGMAQVFINEIDVDTPSTDTEEFIELYDGGIGGTPLDGFILVFFNGNGDVSYRTVDLKGHRTDSTGYFVVGNPDLPQAHLTIPAGSLQNGPDAIALYRRKAADFPNNTPVTVKGLIDAIVYGTGDAEDTDLLVLLNPGQRQVDEHGKKNKDQHSLQRFPNGSGGLRNTTTYVPRPPTPGRSNGGETLGLEIHEVQGKGFISPVVGERIRLSQNVVTAVANNGFFIETPASRRDRDPTTSQGLFVYSPTGAHVQIGDLVDVVGEVQEYKGLTELVLREEPLILSPGHGLSLPVFLDQGFPSPDPTAPPEALESIEGMRIQIIDGMVCGPTRENGEAWIVAFSRRTFREPGIPYPGRPGLPVWDGNPERIRLASGGLGLALDPLPAGTRIDTLVGIWTEREGSYRILPISLVSSASTCLFPVREKAPDELSIGTLNVHRLFDPFDDPDHDDPVVDPASYQRRLDKLSDYIRQVLQSPDILAVQEAENRAVLEALCDRIGETEPEIQYTPFLIEGHDPSGIDVGFLVRETIRVDSLIQVGWDAFFAWEGDTTALHDRPPLLLYGRPEDRPKFRLVILNVHLRSMIGLEGPDSLRVRHKRWAQALDLARRIQALQERDPEIRLLVAGDFNAFEFSDGWVDVMGQVTGRPDPNGALLPVVPLVDPPWTNRVFSLDPLSRYSYVYKGNAQVLDHLLVSPSLDPLVTGIAFGRGNADAPVAFGTVEGPLAASDHDGLVAFLRFPERSPDLEPGGAVASNTRPEAFEMACFPNPANPETQILLTLPTPGEGKLVLFDPMGRWVTTLFAGLLSEGLHRFTWDGRNGEGKRVSAGIYFITFSMNENTISRKIIVAR